MATWSAAQCRQPVAADFPRTSIIRVPPQGQRPPVAPPIAAQVAPAARAFAEATTLPLDAAEVRSQAPTMALDVIAPVEISEPTVDPAAKLAQDDAAPSSAKAGPHLLHREEAERAQVFGYIMFGLCAAVLLWLPVLSRGDGLEFWMAAALAVLGAVGLAVSQIAAQPERYTKTLFRIFGGVAVGSSTIIEYYLGFFSPTPLAVTLGIGFFGQGGDRAGAIAIGTSAAAAYACVATAIASGLLMDRGIFDATAAEPGARWFMCMVVPIVMIVSLVQARANRRAAQDLAARAAALARVAVQQEARFHEVRNELNAVVRPAGGALGPASGRVAGNWRLEAIIGRGGFGEVYASHDIANGGEAAVKVLRSAWVDDSEMLARFRREVDIVRQLRSPHLVAYYGAGKMPTGEPYMAMELLRGADLASLLREKGRLSNADALAMVVEICEGLDVVHRAGCVHRDLKPQNLFLAETDHGQVWKILDFGVSSLAAGDGELTVGARPLGTPAYMSPEQARGERVDARGDVFSLGCALYRAVVGHPPFRADASAAEVATMRPPPPRELNPQLSPDLSVLLTIALAPDPGLRFSHAAEFLEAARQTRAGQLGSNWWMLAANVVSAHPWAATRRRV